MDTKQTGGSAYPHPTIRHPTDCIPPGFIFASEGMTLRDYFAARAPMPIPDWFKHSPNRMMPTKPDILRLTTAQRAEYSNSEEFQSPEVIEYSALFNEYQIEMDCWRDEQRERKFFSWRFYFADMMLAERAK